MSELEPTTGATPEVVENEDTVTEQAGAQETVTGETEAEASVAEVVDTEAEVPEAPEAADAAETEAADAAARAPEAEEVVAELVAEELPEETADLEPGTEPTERAVAAEGSAIDAPADDLSTSPTPADEAVALAEAVERAETTADLSVPAEVADDVEPAPGETPETAEVPETPETAEASETAETAEAPAAKPVPRPSASGVRPVVPTPGEVTPSAVAPHVAPPSGPTEAENAEAARWGRVEEDGSVYVREAAGERLVGQYAGGDAGDALAFYVQRYWDLTTKVVLFEARLGAADLSGKEIDSTIASLDADLIEPAAVGDLDGLRARVDGLREIAAARRAAVEAERAAAKQAALEARTAVVEAAEKIAATDPARIQWRPSGERFQQLLAEWKEAQRKGPRLDRPTEDALWKRFSAARSTFDRERHRYFAELEKANAGAKAAKEALVLEAEKLSTSTDWGATAGAYRDLMTRWKAAGRAARKDDDALWARFRAAQDAFFEARNATNQKIDEEYGANLEVKLALLEEAEKLVPVTDLAAAKVTLREIQERWEKAGKVPRADVQRVEGRMHAVEQAVRDAEQIQWRRTNPETRARAEGAAAQLHAAIASLEDELAAATAKGNKKAIAEVEAALAARRAWLEQVEKAAEDSRG